MDNLDKYIEEIKEKTKEFTELEKIRYVYISLGKIMSFDLEFSYGNEKRRTAIYYNCSNDKEDLNQYFDKRIITCRSISYLFKYILKQLKIRCEIVTDTDEQVSYQHVSNVVIMENKSMLFVDLQQDLENIQANFKTKHFDEVEVSEEQLKIIDRKIGYIGENSDYTENYFYMLKKAVSGNIPIKQKIEFILNNINVYTDINNMGYVERKSYYIHFISKFINEKEKNKINYYDCYQMSTGPKQYQFCVVVNMIPENIVFLYSPESKTFNEISLEELANLVKNGLVIIGKIQGLNKYMNKQK